MTGMELDKLVGEKVMRWTHKPGVEGRWYEYDNLVATEDWSPSTDIADAWRVVEKFNADDCDVFIQTDGDGWLCDIEGENLRGFMGRADTAPMAICLAALKAAGQEVRDGQ